MVVNVWWIDSWSPWNPVRSVYKVKIIFIEIIRHLLFPLCDICTDGAQTMAGKVASSRAQIKARHICPRGHCILHYHILPEKKKKSWFHLRFTYCVKSLRLNTHPFNILYDTIRSKHKVCLLYTEVWWLSQGKALIWLRADLADISMKTPFLLE